MARGVPSGYTRFLERLLADLPALAQRKPELANYLQEAQLLRSDYEVGLSHPLMSRLRWAFRQNRKTKSRESKTFNVECVPRNNHVLNSATVERVWRESGLQGEVGFQSSEFFFQIEWGYGNETDRLIRDKHLADKLCNWAIDALCVAIQLVEGRSEETSVASRVDGTSTLQPISAQGLVSNSRRRLELWAEGLLEDLIVEQWNDLDFGADLVFIGRQVRCSNIGIVDILARDRENKNLVVIELKKQEAEDEVFGQLSRYMGWVKENHADREGVHVEGIIIASEITPKLRSAVASHPHVRALRYDIRLALVPQTGACPGGPSKTIPGKKGHEPCGDQGGGSKS